MKLRAEIAIEIEAADYRDAAQHQHALEEIMQAVRASYSDATFVLKTRRLRVPRTRAGRGGLASCGPVELLVYDDD